MSDKDTKIQDEKDKSSLSKAVTGPQPTPGPPPDGGLDAWLVVFGGWCCFFVSFGWVVSIGIFQAYYEENQLRQSSSSDIAWILSFEVFVVQILAPFVGYAFDSYGPRYLLLGGTIMHVFGLMMLSLCSQYYQIFLAQSVCSSIGISALFYTGNNAVSTWFAKRRALALGVVASGASVGGVIFPIVFSQLKNSVGFGWAVRVNAFIILAVCVVANIFTRSRLVHKPKPFRFKMLLAQYKDKNLLLVIVGCFFFFWGFWIPYNYLTVYSTSRGLSNDLAYYQIVILNAASTPGRILPAYLGDRFGRFNMLCAVMLFCMIFVFGLWIPAETEGPIIAFAVTYGFFSGAFISLLLPVVAQISDVTQIGIRIGMLFWSVSWGALTGNPIGGALQAQDQGGYRWLQVFAGLTMAIGIVIMVAARMIQATSIMAKI